MQQPLFYGSTKPISSQGKTALVNLKRAARKYKGRRPRVYATTLALSKINSHVVDAVLAQQLVIGINGLGYYSGSSASNSLQLSFSLSSLNAFLGATGIATTGFSNQSNFCAIYDQYRIKKVELEMMFNNNTSTVNTNASLPVTTWVIDYDDAASLSSSTNTLGYSSAKAIQFGANGSNYGKQMFFLNRPTTQILANYGTGSSAAQFTVSPWLDTDSTTIQHFGIKSWCDADPTGITTNIGWLTINIRMHVQFKNIK